MLKALVIITVVAGIAYFLFYPFLKTSINRKRLFRWFIIIYVIIMVISTINTYMMN